MMKNKFYKVFYGPMLPMILILASCVSVAPSPQLRPLSAKELNVKIEQGNQDTTLQLNEKCKPMKGIKTFYSNYNIRTYAASIDANVAQLLYEKNNNGCLSYDVRFWSCP